MVAEKGSNLLGVGLYSTQEAAEYARVQTQLLTRWLYGAGGDPVIDPQLGRDEKTVTFLDLVQALAIREITTLHRITLLEIRKGYDRARTKYGIQYPFAVKHRTFLFGDQDQPEPTHERGRFANEKRRVEVVIETDTKELIQLTGREHGSRLITAVAGLYIKELTFGGPGGVASEYRPLQGILLNPRRRFGEPIVESCDYSVRALLNAYRSEGGVSRAARAYGITENEVETALAYVAYLQKPAA